MDVVCAAMSLEVLVAKAVNLPHIERFGFDKLDPYVVVDFKSEQLTSSAFFSATVS